MTVCRGAPSRWGISDADVLGWDYLKSEKYQDLKLQIEDNLIGRLDGCFRGRQRGFVIASLRRR